MAEQDKDRLHIRLHVYDDDIEVKVNRDEEEYYRKAAKLITERYNAYAQAYKGRKSEHTVALITKSVPTMIPRPMIMFSPS